MPARIKRDRLLDKCLRLGAFLFAVNLVASLFVARHVRAQVHDLMRSVGSQMMQLGEKVGHATPRTIRLNGAALRLRVETAMQHRLDEVLDTFEARCRRTNGRFHEQLSEAELTAPLSEQQLSLLDGVMRSEDQRGREGMVACLDVGDEKTSPTTILSRAQRFLETGDVSELGHLRYVHAEQTGENVFLVMLWSDGPLNVRAMFPAQGDAPGLDFDGLPRPPRSRRVLSAWEEGEGPALNMYLSSALDAAQVDAHYRATLPQYGFHAITEPVEHPEVHARSMMAMRDGLTAIIAAQDLNGQTITSVLPMDGQGAATMEARAE